MHGHHVWYDYSLHIRNHLMHVLHYLLNVQVLASHI